MKTITLANIKQLLDFNISPKSEGFGLCGYDIRDGGYIYLNEGYGNMETYIQAEELIELLEEDEMVMQGDLSITINDYGDIEYCHFYLRPNVEGI